jgi:hypothetical protein
VKKILGVKCKTTPIAQLNLAFVSSIVLPRRARARASTKIVGVLLITRTVVTKWPVVTRAISAIAFGIVATGRWFKTPYEQRLRSTLASASGSGLHPI